MNKKLLVCMLACFLAGCAQNNLGGSNRALYFPECYQPLAEAGRLDSKARDIGVGAGKGFLLGTLAGAVGGAVSSLFTGNALNIVSGAAIGAASGTVVGGVQGASNNNLAEKNRLMAQWQQQTTEDIQALPFNQAAATMSLRCYNKKFAQVQKDMKDGLLTNQAAEPMLTEIEAGRQEASNLYMNGN